MGTVVEATGPPSFKTTKQLKLDQGLAVLTAVDAAAMMDGEDDAESLNATTSLALSSLEQGMQLSNVMAPPGKLGIVIDRTLEGPVVYRVNPGTPLAGAIHPGGLMAAVDNVDTRAMNAMAIMALMVKNSHKKRTLTVLSEDITAS